ncbi:MAG: hypothetical protein A2293_04450 [Elusimicrobia bacterium RIFOXYB2_FULL_49_7]|nr:MAG: hypothetical protein A2293_04450 [Elusimicrobia bacterium RIFOXYB2_FULL_49_7]
MTRRQSRFDRMREENRTIPALNKGVALKPSMPGAPAKSGKVISDQLAEKIAASLRIMIKQK